MNLMRAAVMGVCAVLVSAGGVQAGTMEVTIPFEFSVGAQKMPAGVYRIERNTFGASSSLVVIRGEQGTRAQLMVQTTPLADANPASGAPVLVFVPYETEKQLTAIWESEGVGLDVPTRRDSLNLFGRILVPAIPRA